MMAMEAPVVNAGAIRNATGAIPGGKCEGLGHGRRAPSYGAGREINHMALRPPKKPRH